MSPPFPSFRLAALGPAILLALGAACGGKKETTVAIETAPVERRDIVVNASATGVVEPVTVVEIKSKASGQVTAMPVDVGSQVSAGQLLVQIDTRDVKNQYDQAVAALRAAQARLDVSAAQKKRADDLFRQEVITAQEHETAALDYANAQAAAVKARTDADIARVRLEDATVRAPVAGTIIDKPVSLGQVITSATSSASGGTTILKMADLSKVRVRALVNETDIGQVQPGQTASVNVDAFPDRRFRGTVEKVEPQAVVQQSVTMFPVLIAIDNSDRALMPGMNGQVSMLISRRDDVLAIPSDASRSMRELPTVALALGLDVEEVRKQLAANGGMRMRSGGETASVGGDVQPTLPLGADSARNGMRRRVGGDSAFAGRRRRGDSTMAGGRRRAGDTTAAGGRRRGQWSGGGAGGAGGAAGSGQGGTRAGGAGGGFGAGAPQVVFVKNDTGYEARAVRLGVTDFDYTEVLSGLREGEEVALLSAATMQAQRDQQADRIRNATGGALPGAGGGGGGGARVRGP